MKKVPVTLIGHKKLVDELDKLKNVDRPRVIAAIAEARAHGDLSENAEYHSARHQQGFIEGKIRELEGKLSYCEIIDISKINSEGRVVFGATVTLHNVKDDIDVTYQIVGEDEADIKVGKISVTSPLARAMIGKNVDDEVIVITPQGNATYEVINIQYVA